MLLSCGEPLVKAGLDFFWRILGTKYMTSMETIVEYHTYVPLVS